MGLDQYWLAAASSNGDKIQNEHWENLHYHRKVGCLEAFMANEWALQGNEGVFNCENLEVTLEILDKLDADLAADKLDKNASGFFWGNFHDGDFDDIKEASAKARQVLIDGGEVRYTSWW